MKEGSLWYALGGASYQVLTDCGWRW